MLMPFLYATTVHSTEICTDPLSFFPCWTLTWVSSIERCYEWAPFFKDDNGFIFLFGNLLYSSSRSQKAIALSSAEAEIYAATSACCDGVLLEYCLTFVGGTEKVVTTINMDNSAGRAFLLGSGVGRIRHISLVFACCGCNRGWKRKVWSLQEFLAAKTLQTWGPKG